MKKKSLSAKIIPRKLNFNKFLKDKKIFKIYKNFEKNFENFFFEKSNPRLCSFNTSKDIMILPCMAKIRGVSLLTLSVTTLLTCSKGEF